MATPTSSRRAPWMVLLVSLTASFAAAWGFARAQTAHDRARFENEADEAQDLIREHLTALQSLLYSTRAFLTAQPASDHAAFQRYAESLRLRERYPAVSGLGLSRVDGEHIRLSDTWPFDDKRAALLGFDLASDPVRRAAFERARDSDTPVATEQVRVLREVDPAQPGAFGVYLPIYEGPSGTLEERRASVRGFVQSGFRTQEFFAALLGHTSMAITVYEGATVLHQSQPGEDSQSGFSLDRELPVAGHHWRLSYRSRPGPDAFSPRRQEVYVFCAGFLVSLALFWVTRNQQRSEAAAEAERARFFALFMQAPVAIAIQEGPEHVYLLANPSYRQFLGNRELVGKKRREVLPDIARLSGILEQVYASAEAWEGREQPFKVDRGDGQWVEGVFNLICQPIVGADGKSRGVITFGFEVTDLVKARQDKEALAADLEAAVRARDTFLAVASHELRTPLTTLQLQSDGLQRALDRGPLDLEKTRYRVQKIQLQSQRLNRLIGDLLDVSRISAGRLALELELVDLKTLTEETLERAEEALARAGCPVVVHANGPVEGKWDRLRIEQVLTNLVANAAKYGAGKPIEITLSSDEKHARVAVSDRGIGVQHEDQARIFERFERAVSERNFGGLGLGLWISKQIVVAHGGSITVESRPGEGSTFTVELPK